MRCWRRPPSTTTRAVRLAAWNLTPPVSPPPAPLRCPPRPDARHAVEQQPLNCLRRQRECKALRGGSGSAGLLWPQGAADRDLSEEAPTHRGCCGLRDFREATNPHFWRGAGWQAAHSAIVWPWALVVAGGGEMRVVRRISWRGEMRQIPRSRDPSCLVRTPNRRARSCCVLFPPCRRQHHARHRLRQDVPHLGDDDHRRW